MQNASQGESKSTYWKDKKRTVLKIVQILGIRSTGKRDVGAACSGLEGAHVIEWHAE